MTDDPYDLAKLRIDPAGELVKPAAKIKRRRRQFTMVPWSWVERLAGASGQTYQVALHVLFLHWQDGGKPFKLTNVMLESAGVSPQSKRRALRELKLRGLIEVEWSPRKSPLVRALT